MAVFVLSKEGKKLMPTSRLGKVRHMLKDGRAVICKRNPFTVQLTYDTTDYTQPVELTEDTGYLHIGVSVKSETCEYVSEEYVLLSNEKKMHDDKRKYRRTRRNRKTRYRKPRFNNRKKGEGWIAPSLKNKADRHIDIIQKYMSVCPITSVVVEVGQFDTQVLKAIDEGEPLPQGLDYQHGPMYGVHTLREAVFQRDNYTCVICKRNAIKDGAILHMHHSLFWQGIHRDKVNELLTVCEKCHTPPNHKEGGKLWGITPKNGKGYPAAAFMNTVKRYIYNTAKEKFGSAASAKMTYGAATKESRIALGLEKSHVNDAYAMGNFHPPVRAEVKVFEKRRRNSRILSKFYDAKYIDSRDGEKKPGTELFNGRISRNHKKDSENLHKYRKQKVSKGRVSTRTKRYPIQSGDTIIYKNKKYTAGGCHNKGKSVVISEIKKSVSPKQIILIRHQGGWAMQT